jgi:4'-phosphopantetheinyl transferase
MALFLTKDLDDPAHSRVGVWKISESEAELRAMTSIPSDELEEISYIKNESVRKQRLAVRALLDALFEEKVYLSHHDNGKPYIENNAINISITHTDKYVAVMLNDDDEVGVDCESLDRDFSQVATRVFSEEELENLDEDTRNEQLAVLWCAKEAIYKLTSQYDVDFAEQIKIDGFRFRDEGELSATYTDKDDYEQELELHYFTFDRHVVVCVSA